jgi:hypothetical protein
MLKTAPMWKFQQFTDKQPVIDLAFSLGLRLVDSYF